jgi:imidazolonepropionase-like amidohydrolase
MVTIATSAQVTFPEKGISSKDNLHQLIKGATIHLEPGKTEVGDILIYKGKIEAIGLIAEEDIPLNTVVYERSEKHIYPSFIELNSDYGLAKSDGKSSRKGPQYERQKNISTYWNEAFHPEVNAYDSFKPNKKDSEGLLKMGFGIALTHNHDGISRGTSSLVLIGDGKANEMMLYERAAQHFSFSKGSSTQDYPSSLMGAMALIRQALYDAQWYTPTQQKEMNVSLQALLDQKDLPMFFEASEANDFIRIQRIAEEFGLEVIVSGSGDAYQVLNELGENIAGVISPLDFPMPFDMSDPELSRYVSQRDLLHWERAPFNPRFILEAAMPLTLSGNGVKKEKDFFKNLRLAVKKGLPADEALASLTTTPAEFLNAEKVGKLSIGFLANFFVTDKEIFTEDSPKVFEHWIKGKRNVISEVDVMTFSGNYDLNINDTYYELSLEGEEKPKGKVSLIQDADTLTSKVEFKSQGNEVVLAFDDPEGNGRFRLSATSLSDNRIWDGRGINPFGKEVLWSAIRTKVKPSAKVAETDTTTTDTLLPLPAMAYPLTAYGQDSLPTQLSVLIQNATVWTLDEKGTLENTDVLISDGKIKSIGTNLDLSEFKEGSELNTIDGTGMHITPGIIDEHSHIAITRGVNEGTQSSTAEVRISDAVSPHDINIYRQLAGGVTTAQLLHGSANPIGGQSAIIKMRWGEDMNDMLFAEAPGFIKFALGENVKQSNWGDSYNKRYPQTRMGVEQFYYDSFYRAKEYGQLKKLNESGKKPNKKRKRNKEEKEEKEAFRTDIELEALLEILNGERFITCHSYVQSEINMLMHVADSMGFTLNTFTHILEGYKVADKMKEHGASASTFSDWWAYKYEVKDAIPHNASMLNRMGVTTAINSDDAEMGRRLNQEAAKGIRYGGMSEEDALKMVTLNPAKMLHIDEYVGSITEGKDADIVIWSDHPLSVYAKAMKTFVDGKIYFDRDDMELRKVRDEIERNEIATKMSKAVSNGSATQKPTRKMERYYHCDTKE